jgi:molybdate transport system permease protein
MIVDAVLLSLRVTVAAGAMLFVGGLLLGLLLARTNFPGKLALETAVQLPLVLPPTVVGYYLLLLLGRGGPLVEWLGINLVFTWPAIALAAAIMGLPLMVQATRVGLASVDHRLEDAARSLGAGELEVIWRVSLPLAKRPILAGLLLGTTRALGEFGASMMVAGNVPGKTQTMPLAIYAAVQADDYAQANLLVALTTLLAFGSLWASRLLEGGRR